MMMMMMKMSELTEKRKEKKKRILRPKMRKRRKDIQEYSLRGPFCIPKVKTEMQTKKILTREIFFHYVRVCVHLIFSSLILYFLLSFCTMVPPLLLIFCPLFPWDMLLRMQGW